MRLKAYTNCHCLWLQLEMSLSVLTWRFLAWANVWKNIYPSASEVFRVKSGCALFVSITNPFCCFLRFFQTIITSKLSLFKLFRMKKPSSPKSYAWNLIYIFVMKLLTSKIWWNCLQPASLAACMLPCSCIFSYPARGCQTLYLRPQWSVTWIRWYVNNKWF